MFAYAGGVPNLRKCRVSFTDSEGITHSVEVAAGSLYEAAALAVAEFRQSGFVHSEPGAASKLVVTVEAPTTTHELPLRRLETWLTSSPKSPAEQLLKQRLRELVGRE